MSIDATVDNWNGDTFAGPRGGARKDGQSCRGKGAKVGSIEENGAIILTGWIIIFSRLTLYCISNLIYVNIFHRKPKACEIARSFLNRTLPSLHHVVGALCGISYLLDISYAVNTSSMPRSLSVPRAAKSGLTVRNAMQRFQTTNLPRP